MIRVLVLLAGLMTAGCAQRYDSIADDELCQEACELKIPKKIHQVWHAFDEKRTAPPARLALFAEELKRNHPDWEYIFWTKEKSNDFIKTYYPDFYPIYTAYREEIQRADAIRYFALDHFGGVYADFDSQSLRNLEPLMRGFDAVFGEQPTEIHAIANGFMASVPKHPLWKYVFDELRTSTSEPILHSTGPEMLTRAIHNFRDAGDEAARKSVKVVGPKYFFPVTPADARTKGKSCRDSYDACRELFPEAFAVEHWSNSW